MIFKDSDIEYIKNWIRPLQRSLTLESEAAFINILGNEKYFNEYLFESLENLDHLRLKEEYNEKLNQYSLKFKEYNKLSFNQRKRLVVDTRKILFNISKSFEIKEKNIKTSFYSQKLKSNLLKLSSDISLIKRIFPQKMSFFM